jgi:hypothetical protein
MSLWSSRSLPRKPARLPALLSMLFLISFFTVQAYAVDVNARIKGAVTDPQGSIISGAKITATNTATGVKYETTSGSDGGYLFPQLPVGTYSVTVTSPSFKVFTATGIVLTIDQEFVENIQLQVGSITDVVEVAASAIQVNTTDMQLSNIIDSEQMVELPLIGRNFTGLELTLPGVQASSDRFGTYSVSGGQTQQSAFLINGADTNDIALNTLVITPNLDALDQFNLIEGPLNAEYDRNSGGIVSATIKAGTNQFHGTGFEFYRDTFLNTANFYNHTLATNSTPSEAVVATYHQNIFGGVVGGPIWRNKLFFFGAYQGTRQVVPESGGNVGVYFGNMTKGDFSIDSGRFSSNPIPSSVVIPGCAGEGETWAQCAASNGGVFPASAFNSVAVNLANKYVPAPNSGNSYLFKPVTTTKNNQYIGRVDYSMNPENQIYGLFIIFKQNAPETLPFTGASLPGFGDVSTESINQITLDYVHQFSPTVVNDFAAHYTRFNYDAVEPQNPVAPSTVGFDIAPENTSGQGLPLMSISGLNGIGFSLGFSNNGPQPRIDQVIQLDDGLSKVLGRHNLKFGYDGRRFNVSNPFSANNNGNFSFNPSTSAYSSGDGALDFLFGIPGTYGQGSGATIQASAFLNYIYGQDSWKVSKSLTLNYGLAYSIDTPLHNNQYGGLGIACLNPGVESKIFNTAPLGVAYPGDPGCSNAGSATTHYSEFGPRFGFAWAPDLGKISGAPGKLSVRGGFGIYYNRTEEESALQTLETPPFGLSTGGAADFGGSPSFINPFVDINGGGSEANKFPYKFPTAGQPIPASVWATLEPMDISTFGPNFRAPYAENFQLSIERELPSKIIARVSYVGSLARRNQVTYEGNAETPAGHAACLAGTEYSPYLGADYSCTSSTGRNLQTLIFPQNQVVGAADTANQGIDPNTGITGIVSAGTVGSYSSSSYHSLQVDVRKAVTHGLLFQLSYTYSHALDDGSSFENSGFGGSRGYNQFVRSLNYGDSQFDARQRLVFSPLYIIPKFSGGNYSFKNVALAGWEVSGIATFASGFPYDISYQGATSLSLWCSADTNFYACPDIPNQVAKANFGNPRIRNAAGNSVYITNTATAFTPEALGTFGNIHRDPYHGPGINNTNMILAKNFPLVPEHHVSLQVRIESDNVFNHTQFSNPSGSFTSSNFGVITGAASARQSQLAAKINF